VGDGTQESCVVGVVTHVCINADNKNVAWLQISKEPQYPLNRRLGGVGWAVQRVWTFGRREKSLARVGMDAPFLGRVDMQYSTTLST
jgi:hypothetical protein